jgi:RimJ/RimL family protein N-acetyltransferase
MMPYLKPLSPNDYALLYPIITANEPFAEKTSLQAMVLALAQQEGWTVWDGDKIIGVISLSNFRVLHSVMIHVVLDKAYIRKWASRQMVRQVFHYLFSPDLLDLVKVYSYAIPGVTTDVERQLEQLGFKEEGIDRKGFVAPNGECFDMVNYSMLKEECKWIRK